MAVFFIVLPFIILSATGYRFNSKKNILQKTGIIFLETKPEEVNIYLNGKLVKKKTPARIKNLLPNEYEIKLTKNGYYDWQKKVKVYEGQTTFLQYVRLFRSNSQASLLVAGKIIGAKKNADGNKLLLYKKINDGFSLTVFDISNNKDKEIFRSSGKIAEFKFVENGNKVLVYEGKNIWLIDILHPELKINLKNKIGRAFKNLKLDEFNSNFIFYLAGGQLNRLNLATGTVVKFDYYPLDYYVRGDEYYLLTKDSLNKIFLKKFNLPGKRSPDILANFEAGKHYTIEDVNNNFAIIKQGNKLIVFDKASGKSEAIKGADYFEWNSSGDELLFGNDWELWSYRPREEDKFVLFTRTGEDIKKACWYKPDTHIFFLVGDKIKALENLVSNRVADEITRADELKFIMANKKGDKLYFVGQVKEKQGLFELKIQ